MSDGRCTVCCCVGVVFFFFFFFFFFFRVRFTSSPKKKQKMALLPSPQKLIQNRGNRHFPHQTLQMTQFPPFTHHFHSNFTSKHRHFTIFSILFFFLTIG
eukprot:TRINITY_DN5532_c0_g1_i2.p1 TRINITY_DN5532_c0_g1~~TRINITY_DN5532_c0_g1_i2.p1  ORF type:complete len:100 (+),score=43.28 TRINITY_DN5532_c0_g1_i2:210-509(+)